MTRKKIIFRCDGGEQDGMGHVMRCLSLAKGIQSRGHEVVFVSASTPGCEVIRRHDWRLICVEKTTGEDKDDISRILSEEEPSLLILDSKRPTADYALSIKKYTRLALIDDELLRDWDVDLIVNPNPWASTRHYQGAFPGRKLLVGADFNMIRSEYFQLAAPKFPPKRLLITFGGEDPSNHSLQVLQALETEMTGLDVTLVIGPAHKDPASIKSFVAGRRLPYRLLENVTEMWNCVANADFAISACGTTAWELWAAQRPQLGVVIEEHQRIVCETLTAWGAMRFIGNPGGILTDLAKRELNLLRQTTSVTFTQSARESGLDRISSELLYA